MWHTQKHYAKLQSVKGTYTVRKLVIAAVLMLVFMIKATLQYTCTSNNSTEINEIYHFTSFNYLLSLKIIAGPISGNLYYLAQGSDSSNVEMTTIVKL